MKKTLIILLVLVLFCSCSQNNINTTDTTQASTECVDTTSKADSDFRERMAQAALQLAYIGGDMFFEENDTVDIDDYIEYYNMFELGNLNEEIIEKTNNGNVCVPRAYVDNFFKRKFAFTYDPLSSEHICTHTVMI